MAKSFDCCPIFITKSLIYNTFFVIFDTISHNTINIKIKSLIIRSPFIKVNFIFLRYRQLIRMKFHLPPIRAVATYGKILSLMTTSRRRLIKVEGEIFKLSSLLPANDPQTQHPQCRGFNSVITC